MIIFKKNIWLLFYLIAFIGFFIFGIAVYQKHDKILSDTKNDQLYLTKLYQNRLNSFFNEHEILHNLIGNEYLHNPNFNIETANTVINLNPLLVDIWFFSKEGDLQLSTLPDITFPNLLQHKNTRQWFQETLNTDKMVIGRVYLQKSINKWILPIRKRIRDEKGNIIAVISTGIDLAKLHKRWNKEKNAQNTIETILGNGACARTETAATSVPPPSTRIVPSRNASISSQ
jgi:hypothetical protein